MQKICKIIKQRNEIEAIFRNRHFDLALKGKNEMFIFVYGDLKNIGNECS